ncbi:nucleotidyltransferase family protein [Vibrio agarivorans]|uniref:nucleotidyltransferase family protein n=1 Tax=Vibrio agarivorans TaxID=153622 RepID=UPI00223270DD|nr:nucleotidyltransferase family protein [Vibrio agarivorans]MDN3663189.1 nucleotidyltransferase family protein [Vibrio agarivorans]
MTSEQSETIINLIKTDKLRAEALHHVYLLHLPDCYLAAGFVRNRIWDALHDYTKPTPMNDIDVIYFDSNEVDSQAYMTYEKQLKTAMPHVHWQVRNQARMHLRNGDLPYKSSLEAMSHWPEKETAVGIRKVCEGQYECIAAFDIGSLLAGYLSHNPKRSIEIFQTRVDSKGWLEKWPKLTVIFEESE